MTIWEVYVNIKIIDFFYSAMSHVLMSIVKEMFIFFSLLEYPLFSEFLCLYLYSDLIRSVAQSCLTLCDPMNRSTPGFPVHHQLPEFTEIHIHQVSDAIQPSHPLSSPSPLAPIPPSIRVFSNESTLRMRWPKY